MGRVVVWVSPPLGASSFLLTSSPHQTHRQIIWRSKFANHVAALIVRIWIAIPSLSIRSRPPSSPLTSWCLLSIIFTAEEEFSVSSKLVKKRNRSFLSDPTTNQNLAAWHHRREIIIQRKTLQRIPVSSSIIDYYICYLSAERGIYSESEKAVRQGSSSALISAKICNQNLRFTPR